MTGTGESFQEAEERGAESRVSFLDQALWKHFNDAQTLEEFARAWLAIQCVLLPNVRRAVAVLGEAEEGPFAPVAQWPDDSLNPADFSSVTELALQEQRGVVQALADDGAGGSQSCQIAYPFLVGGTTCGAV